MPPSEKQPASTASARDAGSPYPRPAPLTETLMAESAVDGETAASAQSEDGARTRANSVRHLSCENCRVRKMKCSRQSPCLSCRMRGDKCVWIGQAPNGSADEDELEQSQNEVNRLKKLVDLLLARLEEQDDAEQQLAFYQQAHQHQPQHHDFGGRAQGDFGVAPGSVDHPPHAKPHAGAARLPGMHALVTHPSDIPITPLHAQPPSAHYSHHPSASYAPGGGEARYSPSGSSSSGAMMYAAGGPHAPYGSRSAFGPPPGEAWRSG